MRRAALLTVLALACADDPEIEPMDGIPTPEIFTPRWAFEPWISKDISDDADTRDFVRGFQERKIPVGVVVLDSPWETNYNTFVPNPSRYPGFGNLVTDLREQDIRIVLWVTQMLNEASFDAEPGGDTYDGPADGYDFASQRGYFVNEGQTYFWWKGVGGGIDFFNEEALAWWHDTQRDLLTLGINGWKLDFGESYIETEEVVTAKGVIPHQEYSEEYYRDFLAFGVHERGPDEFVTMVRPYDKSYHFEGRFFARPEHAPVAWVGDNRRDWLGLIDALDHMFRSAKAGYVVVGSDIGGYLDRDDTDLLDLIPYDGEVFLKWLALGAMTPFMQLHGRANLEPWAVPERVSETIRAYRYWATLHHEMVPFFYSLAEEAYDGGATIIRPIGEDPAAWDSDWRYMLGDAFLIAPLIDGTGARDVPLPAGRWYDWWAPDSDPIDGGQTLASYDPGSSERIGVFVKEGAIIPLVASSTITGIGDVSFEGHETILVYPSGQETSFVIHDDGGAKRMVHAKTGQVQLTPVQPTIVRIRSETAPSSVRLDTSALSSRTSLDELVGADTGFVFAADLRSLFVKVAPGSTAVSITYE